MNLAIAQYWLKVVVAWCTGYNKTLIQNSVYLIILHCLYLTYYLLRYITIRHRNEVGIHHSAAERRT